ncbi:universal stress protein A [Mesorhizobium sp. L-8-10]|uniref:universal stress protein n=1 Tax=Mesorhizobium sp. L-8-10 TaxID=2744523 RepID=UPI00192973C4|nr:universal stress protein [Mesorhizobium sp. L-8-10]BCH30877.1 universal stress protein A [Mesorhizobium sp. L-8-10]
MLRSILIALDGSESSARASEVALQLASQHGAHVQGLGIVNSGWIQRPEPVPIGGIAIKAALDLSRLGTARERVDRVLQEFTAQVAEAGISSHHIRAAEGDPLQLVAREATVHDLIAIGRKSIFDVEGELYDLPVCVERIVREEPRPILLVPSEPSERGVAGSQRSILVAFDGSPAASRALHMFALLGLAQDRAVHVVTVADEAAAATETAGRACELLARHGGSQTRAIGLGDREAGRPSETILGLTKSIGAEMIVMGAYGRRGIREILGSTTRDVLNACPTVLFLHH